MSTIGGGEFGLGSDSKAGYLDDRPKYPDLENEIYIKLYPKLKIDLTPKADPRTPLQVFAKDAYDTVTIPNLLKGIGDTIEGSAIMTGLSETELVTQLAQALAAKYPSAGIYVFNSNSIDLTKIDLNSFDLK